MKKTVKQDAVRSAAVGAVTAVGLFIYSRVVVRDSNIVHDLTTGRALNER